jgi:hypothetical protein
MDTRCLHVRSSKQRLCTTSGCTWGNAVDADAIVAQLIGQGLGQAQQRCLADGVPAAVPGITMGHVRYIECISNHEAHADAARQGPSLHRAGATAWLAAHMPSGWEGLKAEKELMYTTEPPCST